MHQIRSWAKAHVFKCAGPSQSSPETPPQNEDSESRNAVVSTAQDARVKEPDGNPQPPGSSQQHDTEKPKPGLLTRIKNGTIRFGKHTKTTLLHSWVNVLLVFVPIGIAVGAAELNPAIVFAMNAIAIVPLAALLSHATECVASRLGDTIGALTNVTFGNAVELIIFIIALAKNEIRIVQASLLGSILANLLLILGMAFLLGGLRFQEQIYNCTITQMSACLLSLSVTSLLLPTAFHASWSNSQAADRFTLKVSRGTSVVLLLVYILYIIFQLKSHAYLYASTPQQIIDEESHPGILAELMNSSSDSSSSSSDESADTMTSWTTAKRIKKAMKYRRRRKSSTSSKGTASHSIRKKNLADMPPVTDGRHGSIGGSPPSHKDENGSSAIDFGDEGRYDADDDTRRFNEPRFRDFGQTLSEPKAAEHRKNRGRVRRRQKREERAAQKETRLLAASTCQPSPLQPSLKPYLSEFCNDCGDHAPESDPGGSKLRGKSPFRANFPSLLSNTVFSSSQVPATNIHPGPPGSRVGLRRTTSMPVRMNRVALGNAVQYARGADAADTKVVDASTEAKEPDMSRTAAIVLLLVSTGLVAACAEFLISAIPKMIETSPVSETFIGLIILPIVGNAAEHVTAVTVATKNKMDLSIGVSVGSSIQIAIFVTPLIVIIGWCMDKDMTLRFTLFETICLFVTAFVVNFLVLDGRSNYLEGALLMAAYVIIALAAFYYPDSSQVSELSGSVDY